MTMFTAGDHVIAQKSLWLHGDVTKDPCVVAGEVYIVRKVTFAEENVGLTLNRCSRRVSCECLQWWWPVLSLNEEEHFTRFTPGDAKPLLASSLADFVGLRAGDEVIAKRSETVRSDGRDCLVQGETYIVRDVCEKAYGGWPQGVYLTTCDSGKNCNCTMSWWGIESFTLPPHRDITIEEEKRAHYLPQPDDVASFINLKPAVTNDADHG